MQFYLLIVYGQLLLLFVVVYKRRLTAASDYLNGTLQTQDIVIIIISQSELYNLHLSEKLKNNLNLQAERVNQTHPIIHLTHSDFTNSNSWTIIPLLPKLFKLYGNKSKWLIFVEEHTKINLEILLVTLNSYNPKKEWFIGHALYDNQPTIIHHFANPENPTNVFQYPNLASGIALSLPLINKLTETHSSRRKVLSDFSIDNTYELALYIWHSGKGIQLQHNTRFCIQNGTDCAVYTMPFYQCRSTELQKESIYFAVKTCEKFHKDRVPIVKGTWGQYVEKNINFFSDVLDETIPTISIDSIPNVAHGHCSKTLWILRYFLRNSTLNWLMVSDDDTILSVARLRKLLTCYASNRPILLGERYGYKLHNIINYTNHSIITGYNYITGGGGIIVNRAFLQRLFRANICHCPALETPDDMFLGMCATRLGLPIVHSSLFHQARPNDYATGYLASKDAVSFHKHWEINPISVYTEWFAQEDNITATLIRNHDHHEDL